MMIHSDEFYIAAGTCKACGARNGAVTQLKLFDYIYGVECNG